MKKNESTIAVIEGKWFPNKNQTVKSFFDFICDLHFENQHAYHYEMFNNGTAFQEILPRMCKTDNVRNLYIAAHGDENGIFGSDETPISITKIKNAIRELNDTEGRLHSIYFGCCLFGNGQNLHDLLTATDRLRWIAGYTKSIDFVESTVLDALFWSKYLSLDEGTALVKIKVVCDALKQDAGGLVARLGFKVIARDARFASGIIELI